MTTELYFFRHASDSNIKKILKFKYYLSFFCFYKLLFFIINIIGCEKYHLIVSRVIYNNSGPCSGSSFWGFVYTFQLYWFLKINH